MGRRRLVGRITGEVGRHRAAQLLEVFERAVQQQRVARALVARGGERIAQLAQRVLLERQARFQFDQALFEQCLFRSLLMSRTVRIERPRPMP